MVSSDTDKGSRDGPSSSRPRDSREPKSEELGVQFSRRLSSRSNEMESRILRCSRSIGYSQMMASDSGFHGLDDLLKVVFISLLLNQSTSSS